MIFRHETDYYNFLDGIGSPSFPYPSGLRLHSYPTVKPNYITSNRYHGTTSATLQSEGVKKEERDNIYGFWNSTLDEGYYDFTVIDHRNRMLFYNSWNNFQESVSKRRGGVYTISLPINSPVPWTLPTHGAYLMTANNLNNHTLRGDNLTLDDGTLVNKAGDSGILRENGYALKLTGTGVSGSTGASNDSVNWVGGSEYHSWTMFCQFKSASILAGRTLDLIRLSYGLHYIKMQLGFNADANLNDFDLFVNTDTSSETYGGVGDGDVAINEWYDCGISYDAVNSKIYIYVKETDLTTFTNLFDNSTDVSDYMVTFSSPSVVPVDEYREIDVLRENGAALAVSTNAYLQNAFIFDGCLSAAEFNTLRRLCFEWNKTTTIGPK